MKDFVQAVRPPGRLLTDRGDPVFFVFTAKAVPALFVMFRVGTSQKKESRSGKIQRPV